MPTLHFGVVNKPYSYSTEGATTLEVARILEQNYGLFATYYKLRRRVIAKELTKAYQGALNSLLNGAPARRNPGASAMAFIEHDFKEMVSLRKFDGIISGVPTEAAKKGVSHRFKRPYKTGRKRGPRPSFRDTGLFLSSVKAWID